MSSGHIVNTNVPHPLLEEQQKRYPMDLRVKCPFCGAKPGQPCVMSWTHPSRTKEAQHLQPKPKTVNDLPNHIKQDLMSYCQSNDIEPTTLHKASTEQLFEYYCEKNGIKGWASTLIAVLDSIREVKG